MDNDKPQIEAVTRYLSSALIISLALGFGSYFGLVFVAGMKETTQFAFFCALFGIASGLLLSINRKVRKIGAVLAEGLNYWWPN